MKGGQELGERLCGISAECRRRVFAELWIYGGYIAGPCRVVGAFLKGPERLWHGDLCSNGFSGFSGAIIDCCAYLGRFGVLILVSLWGLFYEEV